MVLAIGFGLAIGIAIATLVLGVEISAARDDVRGDIAVLLRLHRRRYDDVVGLCEQIQSQLNAMQVDKLKVYVQDKAKPVAMDYESSQQAALDEFKDEK